MKILLILSTVKPEWRPLSSNCRPLPVTVLNGSSCHTGRNKKREASTQYFLNIRLRAFYTLSVGSLFTCYHAQKVLFVLEFMFAFTKLRLQISLPFEHGNVDTNYPRMHVVIFVCVCMCVLFFSLTTQSQAVSDGGKREQPAFPVTRACLCVKVCFWGKSLHLVSLSVNVCLLINGCACTLAVLQNWTCLHGAAEAAAPAFQEPLAGSPARWTECWAGPCPSRSCWRTPAESSTSRWAALDLASCCDSQQAREQKRSSLTWCFCRAVPLVFTRVGFLSPQTFLMSEVSAENILFWQACEKFRKIPAGSLNEVWWNLNGLCPFHWNPSWHFPNFS